MPLGDLDLILNKEAIVATYPAAFLRSAPSEVEQVYSTHARTFIPLGDTSRHVDTLFKWVAGLNKGAFVGAVVGDYGHGKTSFQIHVWAESIKRGVFTVPPFSWDKVSDWIDATAAWAEFILRSTHPDLAHQVERIYNQFREKSLLMVAEETAKQTHRNVDDVLSGLRDVSRYGGATLDIQVTVERFLDYLAAITIVIEEAGYKGLLVLPDEPEVAAKRLGQAQVAQILFELANGLLQRNGNFGVFISLPENFLASVQRSFPSLTARLQDRGCLPRLRDVYGPDFPKTLWSRFVEEFNLGAISSAIVSSDALVSIGQAAESERNDLSYGPRTVVSVFRQMVRRYTEDGSTYEPENLIDDCLNEEVLVSPDYGTRIRQCLKDGQAQGLTQQQLKLLAAFPNGIVAADANRLGLEQAWLDQARRTGVVYKRGNLFGLVALQRQATVADKDELRDAIEEALGEFAPTPETFKTARDSFIKYMLPRIFEKRQGQQFLGWEYPKTWTALGPDVKLGQFEGAFKDTERDYPKRRLVVSVGPAVYEVAEETLCRNTQVLGPELLMQFCLRWNAQQAGTDRLIDVDAGDPGAKRTGRCRVMIDLTGDPLTSWNTLVDELGDRDLFTPLAALHIIAEIDRRIWTREYLAQWEALREQLVRDVFARFFVDSEMPAHAVEQLGNVGVGAGAGLFGPIALWVFRRRYPEYSTLMRQPLWTEKVDTYIRALKNQDIPLAAKRGNESWCVPSAVMAPAFATNPMNLKDAFNGYSNLLHIKVGARGEDYEATFRLHPLEKKIQEYLMASTPPKRLKIEGKETSWWELGHELSQLFLQSGYHLDEMEKIVQIGSSRGTFQSGKDAKGQFVLYCLPIDLAQMKLQLSEKLKALEGEVEGLNQLPAFKSSFDFATVAAQIEALAAEPEFAALTSKINKEFEQCHNRLPGYFDRLSDQLISIQSDASRLNQKVQGSRQVASLKSVPTGMSRWCADLGRYIVGNLVAMVDDVRKESDELSKAAERGTADCLQNRRRKPMEQIAALQAGWVAVKDLTLRLKDTEQKAQDLLKKLDEYEQWRRLLSQSDAAYQELLELGKEPGHVAKANELLGRLEKAWDDIATHLQTRNVVGLGNHRQFEDVIASISAERKSYLNELGTAFNRCKEAVNTLLQEMDLGGDARCRVTFNPLDSTGTYRALYAEALGHLERVAQAELSELSAQRLESLYTRDVLKRMDEVTVGALLGRIKDNTTGLTSLLSSCTAQGIDTALVAAEPTAVFQRLGIRVDGVRQNLTQAREVSREVRKAVRDAVSTAGDTLGSAAAEMLALLPANGTVNLKQIVLGLIEQGHDSSTVLDTALQCLTDLFRRGNIQVTLELPHR